MSDRAPSKKDKYMLRLYVAAATPQSTIALRNLTALCEEHLPGRYQLEVIDLLKNPELAQSDQILAVPTLVRKLPSPIRKFIGNLTNTERILIDFDLCSKGADPSVDPKGAVHA